MYLSNLYSACGTSPEMIPVMNSLRFIVVPKDRATSSPRWLCRELEAVGCIWLENFQVTHLESSTGILLAWAVRGTGFHKIAESATKKSEQKLNSPETENFFILPRRRVWGLLFCLFFVCLFLGSYLYFVISSAEFHRKHGAAAPLAFQIRIYCSFQDSANTSTRNFQIKLHLFKINCK